MIQKLVPVMALLVAVSASASMKEDYFTVASVETVEVPVTELRGAKSLKASSVLSTLNLTDEVCKQAERQGLSAETMNLTLQDLETIYKVGKEVWAIIEKNKPVVNVQTNSVSALPKGAYCWYWLENWQNPQVRAFRTSFKNLFGVKVVDFTYKLVYLHGGSYRNQGKYLARVSIVPDQLEVAWGYTFNANVRVNTVVNHGTTSNPEAGIEMEMTYTVDTVMKHFQQTVNFFARGNGQSLQY